MKKPKPTTRNWDDLFHLCPLRPTQLAAAIGTSRQSLHALQNGEHSRAPIILLGKIADVMKAHGMIDGSPPPTREELARAWRVTFDPDALVRGGDL